MCSYDAPEGTVWVCLACGKRARNRVSGGIDRFWDESCYMHAELVYEWAVEVIPGGRVCAVNPDGVVECGAPCHRYPCDKPVCCACGGRR